MAFWRAEEEDRVRREREAEEKAALAAEQQPIIGAVAGSGDGEDDAALGHFVFRRSDDPADAAAAAAVAEAAAASSASHHAAASSSSSLPVPGSLPLPSLTPKRRQLGGSRSPSHNEGSRSGSTSAKDRDEVGGLAASPRQMNSMLIQPNSRTASQDPTTVSQVRYFEAEPSPAVRVQFDGARPGAAFPLLSRTVSEDESSELAMLREVDSIVCEAAAAAASSTSSSSSSSELLFPILKYGSYEARLATFRDGARRWPHTLDSHPMLTPESMAKAGLFLCQSALEAKSAIDESTGDFPRDATCCYSCGTLMHDWEAMDEAEPSHRDAASHCAFLEQLSLARAQATLFNRLQSEEHAPGGIVVPAAIGSSGSMLQRLLQGGPDDASSVSPRQWIPEPSAPDADSDDLPALQSSTGVSANLVRLPSVREKQQIEIPESDAQRQRALVSTCNASVTINDTTVELFKRAEGEQKEDDEFGLGQDAESVPVTVQVRAPLVPFTAEDPAVSLLQPQAASLLYFQIKIVRFAGGEFEGSAASSAASISSAGSGSSNASGLSASGTFPPLVIGLSTSALHLGSLPPGFDPPVSPSLLNLGLTSSGELLLNGQGPLSGVVGMQSLPFTSGLNLRAGDIVGCKVDLERGVISWHINGRRLGPVNIPLTEQEVEAAAALAAGSSSSSSSSSNAVDPAAPRASRFKALSSFSFYPTVSLLYVGDSVEFQLTTEAAIAAAKSFSSFSSAMMHGPGVDPAGPRDLLQHWQLCSESDQVALATGALADQAPDLGLVLDQTNLKTPGGANSGSGASQQQRAVGNKAAPRLGAASPVYPVVISKILPGYAAHLAGLRVGDTVRLINGVPILALRDAVSVVRKCKPAAILMFEVLRKANENSRGNSALIPFVIPLTLGAKAMPQTQLLQHAQWIHWSKDLLEWVGPPALLPPLAGVARQAALSPRGGSTASSPVPLQSPPSYIVGAPLPPSAIEHIKAMEIALVIERRMSYLKGAAVTNSIFLPEYRSLQKRVQSFNAQMQAWMAPRMPAASASASASAGEIALLGSGGSTVAPKPINVAMHGFVYAPLEGFPFRCICFACGLVLPVVRSVTTLLEAHRQGARAAKQAALALRAPAMARPPSYHQHAELTPSNLDTGCLFLTLYDSVAANLAEVARLNVLNKQKNKLATTKAPSALAASSSSSSVAASSSSSSSAAVASGPVPQVEVVIDVEAENDEADKLMDSSSDAGSSSRMSTPMAKRPIGSGMVVANNDNMANGGGTGSGSSNAKLGLMLGASAGLALGGAAAVAALDPPPNYHFARLKPSVPVGPDLFKEGSHEHDGIVYQAAGQASPKMARVGEWDHNGDINIAGRPPLSSLDKQRRGQNRPGGQQVQRLGGGGGGGYGGGHGGLGVEMMALGNGGYHAAPAVPPPPPPPPQDPSVALREFFCPAGGSKLGLCWKIPFFIMVLPFFLIYESLRALLNGCIWCCEKLCNLAEKCCTCLCKACEAYWKFICITVLLDCFCKNLCDCLKWSCKQLDKYCCTPLSQCCDWMCTQLFDCCAWWHRNCCAPIGRAISRCCSAVCKALSACCTWICTQCERACNALSRCCSAICNALSRCCNAICNAMEKAIKWSVKAHTSMHDGAAC